MTREEFLRLFEKQRQGTLTPEEESRLSAWFAQQQSAGLSGWDEQELGNKKELEEAIYRNILQQAGKPGFFKLQRRWLSVAAALVLAGVASLIWYKAWTGNGSKPRTAAARYAEARAGYGQVVKVTLADSSVVWLNAGSRLRYPVTFDGKARELRLEGEAFFDVAQRKGQPFIVHSGKLSTQVLGTSFDIKAYKNSDRLLVSVATGKVAIYTDKAAATQLSPNQTGTYQTSTGQISTQQSRVADLMAWREGKLVYRNELLSQALEDISNKYGVNITTSPAMKNCRVYGTFHHDQVETLLKMIAYSVNGSVVKKGPGFYISGKGCN